MFRIFILVMILIFLNGTLSAMSVRNDPVKFQQEIDKTSDKLINFGTHAMSDEVKSLPFENLINNQDK